MPRRRRAVAWTSGCVRERQYGEQRLARCGLRGLKHVHRHVQAAAAVGARARTHGQLGHGGASRGGGFTYLAVGHAVADADVHGGGSSAAGTGWPATISPKMRMIVNSWRARRYHPVYAPAGHGHASGTLPPKPSGRAAVAGSPAGPRRRGQTTPGAPARWRTRGA